MAYEATGSNSLGPAKCIGKVASKSEPTLKSKAPGGLFSSGRKVDVYPLDMLFFRNSGKRQADFSRTTNYFFRQAKYV